MEFREKMTGNLGAKHPPRGLAQKRRGRPWKSVWRLRGLQEERSKGTGGKQGDGAAGGWRCTVCFRGEWRGAERLVRGRAAGRGPAQDVPCARAPAQPAPGRHPAAAGTGLCSGATGARPPASSLAVRDKGQETGETLTLKVLPRLAGIPFSHLVFPGWPTEREPLFYKPGLCQ